MFTTLFLGIFNYVYDICESAPQMYRWSHPCDLHQRYWLWTKWKMNNGITAQGPADSSWIVQKRATDYKPWTRGTNPKIATFLMGRERRISWGFGCAPWYIHHALLKQDLVYEEITEPNLSVFIVAWFHKRQSIKEKSSQRERLFPQTHEKRCWKRWPIRSWRHNGLYCYRLRLRCHCRQVNALLDQFPMTVRCGTWWIRRSAFCVPPFPDRRKLHLCSTQMSHGFEDVCNDCRVGRNSPEYKARVQHFSIFNATQKDVPWLIMLACIMQKQEW